MEKIFIVSSDKDYALHIADLVIEQDDSLSISNSFSTEQDKHKYVEYFDKETVATSFKNNALLFVTTKEDVSTGITYDSFVNSDIVCCNIKEFNMISNTVFNEFNIYIMWIDSRKYGKLYPDEINEVDYFEERLEECKNDYMLDQSEEDIVNKIIDQIK